MVKITVVLVHPVSQVLPQCKDRSVVTSLLFTQLLHVCHQRQIPVVAYCASCTYAH